MSDDKEDDNVKSIGVEPQDRVLTLANEICKTITRFYKSNEAEEHLAALFLAEAAVQHVVMTRSGPEVLNRVLMKANTIRKRYDISDKIQRSIYDAEEQPPVAPVLPLRRKDE